MDNAFYQLWFAVRYIHVASAALLTGGAVTLCALCVRPRGEGESAAVLAAPVYEWMFWSLVGLTVVTGVSNLGLKGDGLMAPETTWGRALTMKLTAALVLLALSLVRTDFVIRCSAAAGLRGPAGCAWPSIAIRADGDHPARRVVARPWTCAWTVLAPRRRLS